MHGKKNMLNTNLSASVNLFEEIRNLHLAVSFIQLGKEREIY